MPALVIRGVGMVEGALPEANRRVRLLGMSYYLRLILRTRGVESLHLRGLRGCVG